MTLKIGMVSFVMSWQTMMYAQDFPGEWTVQTSSVEQYLHCSLDSLVGSTLWFHNEIASNSLPLDSIVRLRYPGKSHGLVGALVGATVGAAIGYLTAPGPTEVHHESSWFFGLPYDETEEHEGEYTWCGGVAGGAIGYLIGANIDPAMDYDLSGMSPPVKMGAVRAILQEIHRPIRGG
jgi:hypothetical protein